MARIGESGALRVRGGAGGRAGCRERRRTAGEIPRGSEKECARKFTCVNKVQIISARKNYYISSRGRVRLAAIAPRSAEGEEER